MTSFSTVIDTFTASATSRTRCTAWRLSCAGWLLAIPIDRAAGTRGTTVLGLGSCHQLS